MAGYNTSPGFTGNQDIYFANDTSTNCASNLVAKGRSFYTLMEANYYIEKIHRMWQAYHGVYGDNYVGSSHRVEFTGEQGELVQLPVNHFRNIAQHILILVTSNRPTMEARAVNTDYKSLAQTYLANGILEYYMREKHLEDAIQKACELAIVLGSGFIKLEWNATAGDAYDIDPDTGEFNYEGEIEFTTLSPLDVVFDGTKENYDNDWIMTRSFQNRFDLIAKYPEYADKIRSVPAKNQSSVYRLAVFSNDDTDDIGVYEFYHKRTEAVPEGRYMLFIESDIVLLDTKLPYRTIPVFRIAPSDILGTPYGYSPMFDIFPIQEAINSLYSTIMTNQSAFGVQNIWVPRGADIALGQLSGGLNVIESDEMPQPINLTQTPAEVFKFLDELIQSAETISGISSVTRGNPEASLKSGTALALVQSMSLQFSSNIQKSYVKLIEDVGTALLNILKDFATTPKIVALVGKYNRPYLKEFTGEDINAISRVIVDPGNPLAQCFGKDTPIHMYDGTTKMVQDVILGDQVMGPDSYPRTVSNIHNGEETMYEITSNDPNRNIKYICNESHILTLKYCSDDYRYDTKKGDILDISVRDYLKLPNRQKRLLQGFTVGVEYEGKQLDIPPYILGSWLGDGASRNTSITTMDKELADTWLNYANSINMNIRVEERKESGKAKTYHITSGESHGKSDRNPFMNSLREMELICNKHIPFHYLTASRTQRLELLAGLIDTDGSRIDETYIFTQKSERLSNEVIQLAKSLGFRVTFKKVKSKPSKLVPNANGELFKIYIGGDTFEIPCKLPRKQTKQKEKTRDPLNYGINVQSVGMGEYYGFALKEEPHFLLGDFTVTHNSIAGRVQIAEQLLQMQAIKTPQEYFQVLTTGRLDMLYEGDMAELLLIKSENERMMDGEDVQATVVDQHSIHIKEHKTVIANADIRKDPTLTSKVLAHIQQHIDMLRNTDPDLLHLIGEQPLNPPPQPGQVPPPPGQPGLPPGQGIKSATQGANKSVGKTLAPNAQGLAVPGQQITGPGIQNVGVPQPPKVPASLLSNPALQPVNQLNPKK